MSFFRSLNFYFNSFSNHYRYRNDGAAAALPKSCCCFAKILLGLLIALMFLAAIIVPIVIGSIEAITTS